jgi:hypothetical protein
MTIKYISASKDQIRYINGWRTTRELALRQLAEIARSRAHGKLARVTNQLFKRESRKSKVNLPTLTFRMEYSGWLRSDGFQRWVRFRKNYQISRMNIRRLYQLLTKD